MSEYWVFRWTSTIPEYHQYWGGLAHDGWFSWSSVRDGAQRFGDVDQARETLKYVRSVCDLEAQHIKLVRVKSKR